MKTRAGTGASIGAGKTSEPGWTCPGPLHPVIYPRVGREPGGDGTLRGSPKPVTFQSRGHGRLSSRAFWGARRRQGPRTSYGDPHRLDPDGWLVRSQTDTFSNESPAAEKGRQVKFKIIESGFGGSGPHLGSCCPLDTRLLMGGTHEKNE